MTFTPFTPDPDLDLVLERRVDVPPELVWRAWTEPELLKQFFCPAPWETPECEIDLRPGGVFRTVMRSPEGEEHDNVGCYLEVVPNQKLAWTSALGADYRPTVDDDEPFAMTAILELAPDGAGGTLYRAIAVHGDRAGRDRHDEMGFHEGWGTVVDQMAALMEQHVG